MYSMGIIVTDRVVLDRQLQGTVAQFEQTSGVVKKIDGTSRQLKDAIARGARIIITTIQKFSSAHLKELSGHSQRAMAERFEVAPSTAVRIQARYQTTGSVAPARQGRPTGSIF